MLKVLIILFVIGLVFFRAIGFFLRLLSGSTASERQRTRAYEQHKATRKPDNGNVNIDYVPRKGKKDKSFNGGEYVDFEELD